MSYLRQVQGLMHQGKSLSQACQEIGVTEKIYHRWLKTRERHRLEREIHELNEKGYITPNLDSLVAQPFQI